MLFAYLDPGGGDSGVQIVTIVWLTLAVLVVLALIVFGVRYLLRDERRAKRERRVQQPPFTS